MKWPNFLKDTNDQNWPQEKHNLNNPVSIKEITFIILKLTLKKIHTDGFPDIFY